MSTDTTSTEIIEPLRAQYQQSSSRQKLGIAAGMAAAGLLFIYLATVGAGVVVGLAGFMAVAAGIYPIKDMIRPHVIGGPRRKLWLGGGFLIIVLGAGLVRLALGTSHGWLSALGTLVVVLGLLPFSAYQRLPSNKSGTPVTIVGLLIVVLAAVALAVPAIKLDILLGAALILIGITVYRTGLTGLLSGEDTARHAAPPGGAGDDRVRRAVQLGGAGVFVGTVLVCLGGYFVHRTLFVLGALPGTLALHLLCVASTSGRGASWKKDSAIWKRWCRMAQAVAGIVVLLTWVSLWTVAQQPFYLSTAIALIIASIGAAFVWRGESILLVLLCGFVMVWITIDRSDEALVEPAPGAPRIVAIGDSYMSGEGAPRYYEETNVAGPEKNECRRAPTAYPVLVAEALDLDLQFLACSGAVADNLWKPEHGQMPDASDKAPGQLPQLDYVTSVDGVKFILVSIGGNDARFASVGKGCLLPGSCSDLETEWIANAEELHTKMVPAYVAIRARAGDDIPVIVMPYPLMIRELGCRDVMLTDAEHEFLVRFVETINNQARLSATRAGVHFFEGGVDAFVGDKLCSQDELSPASVNFIAMLPPEGPLLNRLDPEAWMHQSLHPNPTGHGRTAAALISWLKSSPPGTNPEPAPDATLDDLGIAVLTPPGTNLEELPDRDEWKKEQLARAAQEAWPIVVALFLGGWAFAFTSPSDGPFGGGRGRPTRQPLEVS